MTNQGIIKTSIINLHLTRWENWIEAKNKSVGNFF